MTRVYKGWIPTVSGRLSFDAVGTGIHPNPPDCMNIADRSLRYVLCKQERILLDNALPIKEKSAQILYNEIGKFFFICVGEANNKIVSQEAPLKGYLYIFDSKSWNGFLDKFFKESQNSLRDFWEEGRGKTLSDFFSEEYKKVLSCLAERAYFHVPFELKRSGVAKIYVFDEPFQNPQAPTIDQSQEIFEHSLCSQVFFFLKDILHNHQHHDPFTDTLSDAYLVENEEDEYRWRCEALRLLYRTVMVYKRNRKEKIFNSALGLISYANSFKKISKNDLKLNSYFENNACCISPMLDDELLTTSIRASQYTVRNSIQEKIRNQDKLTNVLLALLTVSLSLVGILHLTDIDYDGKDVSIFFHFLSWAIITKPGYCFIILFLISLALAERFEVFKFKKRIDIYRIIVTQDKKKAEIFLYLLGVMAIAISIFVHNYIDIISSFFKSVLNY